MGIDTLLVVLACTVMQILTKTHYSVMVELIVGFRVESHTPDPAATHFYNEVGRLYQEMVTCGPFRLNKPIRAPGLLIQMFHVKISWNICHVLYIYHIIVLMHHGKEVYILLI